MLNNRSRNSADVDLRSIAKQAMIDRGFLIQVPEEAETQLKLEEEPAFEAIKLPDLTSWLWSSIDNDDSRDLDQIEYAKKEKEGTRIYIGVADVDWFVPKNTALDQAAQHNTTSVYTGIMTFSMLPERLSTDLSSLNENVKRLAMVTEMLVGVDGAILESSVYPAVVQNHAQLTYNAVAAWLEGKHDLNDPGASDVTARVLDKIVHNDELAGQLRLQNEVAEQLRERRHLAGALSLETTELQPVLSKEGHVIALDMRKPNRASLLIEDLMVAANQVTASLLEQKNVPSIQRVVKDPERWDRIATLASTLGSNLPSEPDAKSLEGFLKQQRRVNPDHFHELSLSIVKLLGRGEYVLKSPGTASPGHFGLAVQHYSHSTAPNRRYPDLLTQRLLKGALAGTGPVYGIPELETLAEHCTQKEDDANKVERLVRKCIAATVMTSHIGGRFTATVTGASDKGTWVRVSPPPVEGKLNGAVQGLEVGERVAVQLRSVDPYRGFIDFQLL
jgi:VacB/RNase II family 3'-5' exoribonuclease